MIIWGTSHVALKEQFLVNRICHSCGNNQLVLHGIQTYGHIWYLPLLPKEKFFYLTCSKCETSLENTCPEAFQIDIKGDAFKTPWTSYLGWMIILIFFIIVLVNSYFNPQSPPIEAVKNYSMHYDINKVDKGNFLVLDSPKEKGYLIAHVLDRDNDIIYIKLSKYLYRTKDIAIKLIEEKDKVFNDDFYLEAYYEVPIDDLKQEFQIKGILVSN